VKTIISLVDDVCAAAVETGMDVSPKDVGFIISLFLQGLADHPEGMPVPAVDAWLHMIADECDKVKDGS
jgi:hypothetical protein